MVESIGFEGIAINVWLVWILPFVGAALIPALAKKNIRITNIGAVGFAIISALLAATLIPLAISGSEIHSQIQWISALNIKAGILADPLSIIMTNLVAWVSSLIMIYSVGYMHGDRDLTRYWFFMLFFIGSMQLIVLSDNLLMVFFGWEGVGFASYALIGFWYGDRKKDYVGREGHIVKGIAMWVSPTHAGIKAFLMTRAGDVMMLSGMFLIFMYAGTFGFKELLADQTWAHTMMAQNLLVPAAVLLFGGAIGKSAQFPLNEWLIEAMTGPTPVSALIHAATMVKAGVFLVARIGPLFFALAAFDAAAFFEVVAWIGAITAFLLATQAIVNPEIKKVLAYSTGSQIGYMMMALGIAGLSTQFVDGYTAGFFHLMSHAMFKASLFMAAGAILHIVGSRFMTDMGGLRKNMNKTFIFMLLSALSLAGAPLITSGFWSKDAIFAALLQSGTSTGGALFFIAFIVAIMTAFYTFRMVGMVFFGTKSKHIQTIEQTSYNNSQSVSSLSSQPSDEHNHQQDTKHPIHEVSPIMWIPFAILAISTVFIGLVGFFFEQEIHSIMASYLSSSFGIGEANSAHSTNNLGQSAGQETEALNPIALVSSFVAFGIGAGLGILFYIIRKKDPEIISRYPVLKNIWLFLYNRWYINSLLYWGFVKIPLRLYQLIWLYFENMIAQGINPAIEYSMSFLSKWVKYTQTGVTQTYLFVFAAGIIIVLIMLYL
ncbi:MAG TPA: NADH-quinone oxidoreductase subunit L [Nitrososphaeraceae archaeon]|nr:NADH-quinone oxidoreductase subunit L [Nitrososphaeraceae archaeon]